MSAGLFAHGLPRDPFYPLCHFGCRSTRKRHEQDASGIGAVDNQVGDSMRQCVGLPGTRTCNDQKRAARCAAQVSNAMLYGTALFRIEGIEVGRCR